MPVGDVGVRIVLDGVRCDVWCGAGRHLMCDCLSGPTRAHTCVVPARRSNHSQHHHKYATISSPIIYTCGQQVMGGWDDGPCAIPLALPGERAFTRAGLLSSTAHGVLNCRDLDAGRRASHTQHQVCQHDGHRSAMDPAPSPAYARLLRRARDRSARARSTCTTTHAWTRRAAAPGTRSPPRAASATASVRHTSAPLPPLTAVLAASNCFAHNGTDGTTCTQCAPGYELTYHNATSHWQIGIG